MQGVSLNALLLKVIIIEKKKFMVHGLQILPSNIQIKKSIVFGSNAG